MRRYGFILLALTLCVGVLSAQTVKVDWDRATDFGVFKTYKWTKIPTETTPSPEMDKLIRDSASVQIEARGFKKIDDGDPDLYVGYSVTVGDKKKSNAAPSAPDPSTWQTGTDWSVRSSSEKASRKGTLTIAIADRKRNLLIWRGTIEAEIGDSVNDARAKVSTGLSKAFAKFPPPPK